MNAPTGLVREQGASVNAAGGGAAQEKVVDPPASGLAPVELPAALVGKPIPSEGDEANTKVRGHRLLVWTFWSQIGIFVVTALGIGVAFYALDAYKAQNRVAARAQLYAADQAIALREIDKPICGFLYTDFDSSEEGAERTRVMMSMITSEEWFTSVTNAQELYQRIWGVLSSKYLTELLAALYSAQKNKYLSQRFAFELRRRLLGQAPRLESPKRNPKLRPLPFGKEPPLAERAKLAEQRRKEEAAEAQKDKEERERRARYVAHMLPRITEPEWSDQFADY